MRHFLATVLCVAASCTLANASIIFTLGDNPQPGENNVLLDSSTTGTLVTGTLKSLPQIVDFTSSQTLTEPSSGQARVEESGGVPLTDISIALENSFVFGDIIFNPAITGPCNGCGGTANVTVNSLDSSNHPEAPSTFAYSLGNGNNFLTTVASGGESITSVSISITADSNGNAGVNDLEQVRISGISPVRLPLVVPEPGVYLLLGSGLGLLGLIRHRRSQARA